MKTRLLLVLALLFVCLGTSQAGWGWGGGGYCGPRGGFGWGGYGGPRYGGWGGWGGPAIGIAFAAPIPVYRPVYQPVYYAAPAPYYTQRVVRVSGAAATLMRAQSQLSSLGYYRGAVDGSFGPLTSRALVQYQADYGLPLTGRLDRATLKSLGV